MSETPKNEWHAASIREREAIILWLESCAENTEANARGTLGQMFVNNTQADTYRKVASILREHPEVLDRHRGVYAVNTGVKP